MRERGQSLRAFARDVGITPGRLSELLSGKRNLTWYQAKRIARALGLPPERQAEILDLVQTEEERQRVIRSVRALREREVERGFPVWSTRELHPVANWIAVAVLNLTSLPRFRWTEKWIASRLAIRPSLARRAMRDLRAAGLVRRTKDGWRRVCGPVRTTTDVPSEHLREFHRQHLALAGRALEDVPVERREISGITMAIDPDRLAEAKTIVRKFRRAMSELMENGNRREVYHLGVALFPLTRGDDP